MGVKAPWESTWESAVSSSITKSDGASPHEDHEEGVTISHHLHKVERIETDDGSPSATVSSEHTLISQVQDQGTKRLYNHFLPPSPYTLKHTHLSCFD